MFYNIKENKNIGKKMREINKNLKLGRVHDSGLKKEKAEQAEPQFCADSEEICVKDFSNPTAEVLGRSQVNKTDNLKEDVSFAMSHPELIESSDKFFEMAYNQLLKDNDPNAYEKASSMATMYAKEFSK